MERLAFENIELQIFGDRCVSGNVLLLRNNLNLSSDVAEVSQEKLLSLVAERLIDSNSNVNNKDSGYIENQQQNIADAIDLLPRLTTGIDVNLKFTRIDDFEFTRECAIFDLLDIPLYHGWIVDPQDSDTADAIGSKSYNTLMGELVALESQNTESELKNSEEDFVDFVAATTASLGVPSPSLSTTKSFDEKKERKGDLEEEKELLRIQAPTEKHDVLDKSEKPMDGQNQTDLTPTVCILVDNSRDEQIQDQSAEINDVNLESSKDLIQSTDVSKSTCLNESGDGSEPLYEGEEHIHETSTANYDNGEPMYEGEVGLAQQVDRVSSSANEAKGKDGITPKQGELIRNFLKNSANQLTIYGLFSLQEGLKERELCVFFRNNHFNTMFKLEGELYLLATDQGYINQPDLVWEKLNEVNGDTVYMTGSFKEFNAENPEPRSWDEQNALANTAEYIASIDNSAQENTSFNSDFQLAIALQQQEIEQQQQQQQSTQHNLPQPNTIGGSGLVTGPQHVQPSRPRNSSSSSKQESKASKDKCNVM
ncbi:hypothetical protein E3N88_24888 [Mikania micrantha]|uniref:MINDY deubiquitinase domain-containing protein n=1 Tax=Mikania micrantha TaxID=192012 RepID=A0A5N6N4U0_9ASTR|nr:hypothetical protein E3N88_24888 [Mikania micrantha]